MYSSGQERFWNQTRLYSFFFLFMYVYILWQGQKAVLTILEFEFVDIFYTKFQLLSTFSICSKFCVENWLLCGDLSCKWVTCRSGCKQFWKQNSSYKAHKWQAIFFKSFGMEHRGRQPFSRGIHLVGTIALRIQWQNSAIFWGLLTSHWWLILSLIDYSKNLSKCIPANIEIPEIWFCDA